MLFRSFLRFKFYSYFWLISITTNDFKWPKLHIALNISITKSSSNQPLGICRSNINHCKSKRQAMIHKTKQSLSYKLKLIVSEQNNISKNKIQTLYFIIELFNLKKKLEFNSFMFSFEHVQIEDYQI